MPAVSRRATATLATAADQDPRDRERQALAQDHFQHVRPAGANGHADADFPRPARHRVRDQTVEPDERERQSEQAPIAPVACISSRGAAIACCS